jgi:2-polyprenyl-3-methyl-5-hydroxy-6-metoxy-1,4-benzoquinol methylase
MWHAGYYDGLPVHADSVEIHEEALALLQAHADRRGRVLDVGAGAGAFSKRLLDHGFTNIEALELRAEAFHVAGVPVHTLDLHGPWADQLPARYDAAVALEVIEHLENPWHFARQCAAALRPEGVVVLSTPNIESSRSRIEFLLRAEFRFFGLRDYERVGHITSLTTAQILRVFAQAGCELIEHRHSAHKGMPRPGNPKKALRALLYALSYPFMSGTHRGEESLFVFRKKPLAA